MMRIAVSNRPRVLPGGGAAYAPFPTSYAERHRVNYYRRFVGDYLKDTQHLTTLEHGIYTLLLDHLYSTEKPIATMGDAYRICRCQNSASRRHCKLIVSRFFYTDDLGIWHKRVEEEISHANLKSNAARDAANAKWKRHANAMRTHNGRNATSDSRLQTPENSKEESKPLPERQLSGFLLFWEAYPRKVGKPQARRAWLSKVRTDDSWPEVLRGLELWKATAKWISEPEFIPYPATFLNGMRWQDSPEAGNGKPISKADQRDAANVANIAEAVRRRTGHYNLDGTIRKEFQS